jgi:hypothetical protein
MHQCSKHLPMQAVLEKKYCKRDKAIFMSGIAKAD